MNAAPTRTDRVLIVGGGIAALYAALSLAPHPVLLVTPEPLGQGASSAWAQGGVAAAMAATDSPAAHLADTLRAGAGLVDEPVAAWVTAQAAEHVEALAALGAPFDRDTHGGFLLSREAAHAAPRVVRVGGDRAGAAIMATLIRAIAAAPHVQVATGLLATGLVTSGGTVTGVTVEGAAVQNSAGQSGAGQATILSPAVLLAGGGAAGLYALTTNPDRIRGQMMGMAARAGAVIRDAEFVQFHPTAIDSVEDPAPLATEALRGEGAILVNAQGIRFMQSASPEAELAPRDIVARAVFGEWQAGRRPMLDTRAALGARLPDLFPTVHAACLRAGIDPVADPIPVTAAAHYHMGGISVDRAGRASLPSLWVAGEAACTGLHGANRLASNGLLEALVMGRAAARDIAARFGPASPSPLAQIVLSGPVETPDPAAITLLRQTMTRHVGVVRDAAGLHRALATLAALDRPDTPPAFANMVAAARIIAAAAWLRPSSCGAHFRADATAPTPPAPSRLTLAEVRALPLPELP